MKKECIGPPIQTIIMSSYNIRLGCYLVGFLGEIGNLPAVEVGGQGSVQEQQSLFSSIKRTRLFGKQ